MFGTLILFLLAAAPAWGGGPLAVVAMFGALLAAVGLGMGTGQERVFARSGRMG